MAKLLVATRNRGKVQEYREMLAPLEGMEWLSLWDVGLGEMEVEETGDTFTANATLKAAQYGERAGFLTLADDSGLVVDALGGAPGVYSARYGAPEVTTEAGRYQLLLQNLDGIPHHQRTARFECVVAIAPVNGAIAHARGTVEGHIALSPRGSNGFGYDPVFLMPDGRTMAELPPEEKHRISHRGRALQAALPILYRLLAQ
jgi:XTP/dITP diphosphohydrolase